MNQTNETVDKIISDTVSDTAGDAVPRKRRSVMADSIDGASARIYRSIARGPLGRVFTSYRSLETRWRDHDARRVGRGAYRPVSPVRAKIRECAEDGMVMRGLRALFHYLFTCPLRFYGLLGLFYCLAGVGIYFFPRLFGMQHSFPLAHLITYLVMGLFFIPLVFSSKTLAQALGTSLSTRWLFVTVLGVPEDGLLRPERQSAKWLRYATFPIGLLIAIPTWWIHPLVVPAVLVAIGVLGMIFAYPEVGVVLTTLCLPTLWLGDAWVMVAILMIVVTWLSFGVKWIFLHRPVRWGLLDVVVLIFSVLVLLSGYLGPSVTPQSMTGSTCCFLLISLFFLIGQLMTTRAHIRRCLLGLGLSAVFIAVLGVVRMIPMGGLDWMHGSPAGTVLVDGINAVHTYLLATWQDMAMTSLLIFAPFLCILTTAKPRPLYYAGIALTWALILLTVILWGAPALRVSLVAGLLVLAFLYTHRTLTVAAVAALPVGCGMWWLATAAPAATQTILSKFLGDTAVYRDTLHGQIWRMMGDHPGGVGWGTEAFGHYFLPYADAITVGATGCQSLYLEILTAMGWPGLLVFAVAVFLFFQKILTCVRYAGNRGDRRVLLAGLSAVVSMLLLGFVRGYLYCAGVLLGFWIVFSLTSAYANVAGEACDELMAEEVGRADREDRMFRVGL